MNGPTHPARSTAGSLLKAALAAVILLVSTGPAGADGSTDPLLQRLQARLDRLQSLRGRFVQSLDSKSLGRPRTEQGRFCIKKPSFMRWDYEQPEQKTAILDGVHSWLYLPGDKEVYRGVMDDAARGGAAWLLMAGRARLEADFQARRLTPQEAGPQGAVGAVALELTPRKPTAEFDRIVLAVDPDRLLIRRLTAIDSLGGRMAFDFFDLEEDPSLPDGLFRFEVPEGVEVVESP